MSACMLSELAFSQLCRQRTLKTMPTNVSLQAMEYVLWDRHKSSTCGNSQLGINQSKLLPEKIYFMNSRQSHRDLSICLKDSAMLGF